MQSPILPSQMLRCNFLRSTTGLVMSGALTRSFSSLTTQGRGSEARGWCSGTGVGTVHRGFPWRATQAWRPASSSQLSLREDAGQAGEHCFALPFSLRSAMGSVGQYMTGRPQTIAGMTHV